MTSYNKASIFTAEHKSDNGEIPLKQPHLDAFALKQETLERIEWLHIKCGFLYDEHLSMLPKTWLEYLQYEEVDVDILENLYNANCTPKYVLVEKDFESWDPKIHGPCNYLQIVYVAALLHKFWTNKNYPHAMFINGISKNTRSFYKGTMNDGTPLSSSDF